jgi:hypothetical protein
MRNAQESVLFLKLSPVPMAECDGIYGQMSAIQALLTGDMLTEDIDIHDFFMYRKTNVYKI